MKNLLLTTAIALIGTCAYATDYPFNADDAKATFEDMFHGHSVKIENVEFGTVSLDSRDPGVPADVQQAAAPGTKIYPVRLTMKGSVRFLDRNGVTGGVTYIQNWFIYSDLFGHWSVMSVGAGVIVSPGIFKDAPVEPVT